LAAILAVFLCIISTSILAELNPEISQQIVDFDSNLTKTEKVILRSAFLAVDELKKLEQSVIKIRSKTSDRAKSPILVKQVSSHNI